MLPTPETDHLAFDRIYEPAEDSYLLLDTLSSPSETGFLSARFGGPAAAAANTANTAAPLVVEVGPGSGVVIALVTAHAEALFGPVPILTAAADVNPHACRATDETVRRALRGTADAQGAWLGCVRGDLAAAFARRAVDVLVFNPPYVPTEALPRPPGRRPGPSLSAAARVEKEAGPGPGPGAEEAGEEEEEEEEEAAPSFEHDTYLLELSYAGGRDGMETTDRLLEALPDVLSARGCAYVLLCAQNRPEAVKARLRARLGPGWRAETVGRSGRTAGWERLVVVRVWRVVEG